MTDTAGETYAELIRDFRWSLPYRFNIADVCVDRWAASDPDRVALLRFDDGELTATTFRELHEHSIRLAAALVSRGLQSGDRLAILLPQSVETVAAHLAAYRLGLIAVPLAALFGPEALRVRLAAAEPAALITNAPGLSTLARMDEPLAGGAVVLCTDGASAGAEDYRAALAGQVADVAVPTTGPDDPALMIFTSGTTGTPKGVLHGHRVLIGHLPGIAFSHAGFPASDDRFWTPSDWAWAGGLLNALLPSLYHGVAVVFGPFRKFDPEAAMRLMAEAGVRNAFLPPTALNLLRAASLPRRRFDLALRTIGSAGETLGRDAFEWSRDWFGQPVNEFYGQTECNYVLGSSADLGISRAGVLGKPIPGHRVAVLDATGRSVAAGEPGEIAIHRDDPGMFLRYWRDPAATAERFRGDWMMTGDMASRDEDGLVTFIGRNDDLIIASGYRIGPGDIEDCLRSHEAVEQAAAIGKPDAVRNEIVKAYVMLRPGHTPSPELESALRMHVRERLSAAEAPREVEFVEEIPLTTSGKIVRRVFRERARGEASRAS